jgi:predicted DNA-binding antitoxin AbrB/MazE fold protein
LEQIAMPMTIQAVFENGVLRPLAPLNLRDHEKVTVVLNPAEETLASWEDTDCYAACAPDADDGTSLEQVQQALAKIGGSMTADFIAERDER